MSNAVSGSSHGDRGISPPGLRPDYKTYRSPHAPQYKIAPNFHGINATSVTRFGVGAAMFGGVAGVALLFFASDVPRVRIDIMQKIPIIGDYWVREIPPEDNPF